MPDRFNKFVERIKGGPNRLARSAECDDDGKNRGGSITEAELNILIASRWQVETTQLRLQTNNMFLQE